MKAKVSLTYTVTRKLEYYKILGCNKYVWSSKWYKCFGHHGTYGAVKSLNKFVNTSMVFMGHKTNHR